MINAALKVFSEYGYHHSSTDEIVKNAGISKGLLFHYFNSKIGLYAFLYDYVTRVVTLEYAQNVEKNENRYFVLYKQMLQARVQSIAQYPYIFAFLNKADEEEFPEAVAEIEERREKYNRIVRALKDRADITIFDQTIDYEKVGSILDYTIDGLIDKHIKADPFRADFLMEEAFEYVDLVERMSTKE